MEEGLPDRTFLDGYAQVQRGAGLVKRLGTEADAREYAEGEWGAGSL